MRRVLLLFLCVQCCLVSICQNVGINMTNPGFPLNFPGTLGDKISLWGNSGNHYGFGIQGNLLQIHSDLPASDIAFGHGSSGSFNELMRIKGNGNVGIGISTPGFPLNFASTLGDKISLYGNNGNHFGFGVQDFLLQVHAGTASDDIAFGYGSSAAFNELMRIKGDGKVGIGTTAPGEKLTIVSADNNNNTSIATFYANNNTQGISIGYDEIRKIGSNPNGDLYMNAKSAGHLILQNNSSGNVGVGTMPNANAKLHVNTGDYGSGMLMTGSHNGITGSVPDLGAGARLMFYPGKAAFRSGYATGTEWDNARVGFYSTAIGYNTIASGTASVAIGNNNIASGKNSVALGIGNRSKAFAGLVIGHYNDTTNADDPNNISIANRIFQIGNGSSNTVRSNAMTVLQNGRVGIGIDLPENILDVGDRMHLRAGASGTAGIWFSKNDNLSPAGFIGTYDNDQYIGLYGHNGAGWGLLLNTSNGNIGIGTSNPTYKLAVNGTIRSKEIRVESGWADFVFENNYRLQPINEVESFIQKNKHLPGIPSSKEIQENGLALGELQTKMMQKIEELTLYLIEANKRIEVLEKKISENK